jgi:SAM-dependent methyltransferase
LEFVNPRPSASILNEFYNQPGYAAHPDTDDAHRVLVAQLRLARLQPLAAGCRVLDIGCGNGLLLEACRMAGCECVGVEPSQQGRRVAAARGFPVYADLAALGEDRPFDLVTLYHVLEHVADLDGLLAAVKTRLKPGGRLCIEVPNLGSARAVFFPLLPRRWRHDDDRYRAFPIHLYGFSAASLGALLRRNGFGRFDVSTAGLGMGRSAVQAAPPCAADLSVTDPAGSLASGRVDQEPAAPRRIARRLWRVAERCGWGENLMIMASQVSR